MNVRWVVINLLPKHSYPIVIGSTVKVLRVRGMGTAARVRVRSSFSTNPLVIQTCHWPNLCINYI